MFQNLDDKIQILFLISVEEEFLGVQELVLFALLMQGAMLEMGLNAQGYIEQQRAYQEMLARNPDAAPIFSTSSFRPTRGLHGIKLQYNIVYSVIGLLCEVSVLILLV